MKTTRKWLKRLGLFIGVLLFIFTILFFVFNEAKPQGQKGPKAEALAQKMLTAVNQEAWDSTAILQWTFKGMHHYLWDKSRNLVQITWDNNKVLLNPDIVDGKAYKAEKELPKKEAKKIIQKAWNFWCNDSFWFNAVVKCFDKGTTRSIVKMEDGTDALLVSYDSGGVTPGDSYLWILDENGLPKAWKMWVKIIPIGGMSFTWENWTKLSSGAMVSTLHKSSLLDLDIAQVKSANSLEDLGISKDIFNPILE